MSFIKTLSGFIFFIIIHLNCPAQKLNLHVVLEHKNPNKVSDTIYYQFDKKLRWEDFKGKVPEDHSGSAVTASGFAFFSTMVIDGNNAELTIYVHSFFSKLGSWKRTRINSAYHLTHEQHHFDITEIGANEFVEELRKAKFTINNYSRQINKIFDSVYKKNIALQQEYDKETKNSINHDQQLKWNERISSKMDKLKSAQANRK